MTNKIPVTVAYGDGIGPEIMTATLAVLNAVEAPIAPETIEIGEQVYKRGILSGIDSSAWDSLRRTKVFLKAPITTPQGGGYKSLNVTIRKSMGLYANVRPCRAYSPFIQTKHPAMDMVIIRENEEDLYAGIEHRQTPEVMQCLKLITVPGCERIIRYAFEYTRQNNRRRLSCFTKDNIMKMTDGLFHKLFNQIAQDYPEIETDHFIIDIGAARLADTPEMFDVIVLPNLYGDILSDIAAQISGSVGLGGSANIGDHCAMFEAIHGSAPTLAGQNRANPSGLLLGSVMMLVHLNLTTHAEIVHNAWLRTLEDGVHTEDIFRAGISKTQVGTQEFAAAVIERLGQQPTQLQPVHYATNQPRISLSYQRATHTVEKRELVGIDVFIFNNQLSADELADKLQAANTDQLTLSMISNRGIKVWPQGYTETLCTDHWRCRFKSEKGAIDLPAIIELLQRIHATSLEFIKTEHLYEFDGQAGYSVSQGE